MGVVDDLRSIVGPDHVLTDPEVTVSYATDWTGRFRGSASVVVRPASTAEVSGVLAACAAAVMPVVPQGGNTGLVGGSVPRDEPMVVLSTVRLRGFGEVDAGASQVTLGAGVTIAEWRRHAQAAGFDAPVDFAGRDVGDRRRGGGDERRGLAGRALRHDAVAGRRAAGRARRRFGDRLAGRPAQGDGRRPLAVAAGRQRGHARRRHRGPPEARAVVPPHGHGDGGDARASRRGRRARRAACRACRTSTRSS